MVPPESMAKGPKKPCHSVLTRLVKELGQVTDPDLKGSCKARRTALKAVLACLQSPTSTAEERQQVLAKSLAAQVQLGPRVSCPTSTAFPRPSGRNLCSLTLLKTDLSATGH